MKFIGVVFFILLAGCQTNPTAQVNQERAAAASSLVASNNKKITITKDTVVVDARKYYQYNMKHVPNSIQLNWNDFFGSKKIKKNSVKRKSEKFIKRLALKGIHPDKDVVVLGAGDQGKGDAASLSWVLFSLGIENIQYASIYELKLKLTTKRPIAKENQQPWKFKPRKALALAKGDLFRFERVFVVDVRDKKEYLVKSLSNDVNLEMGMIVNVPYKEFFTYQGRPDKDITSKLSAIGVSKNSHIVLVSNKGKRATAAAMSLLSLGWFNAHVLFL